MMKKKLYISYLLGFVGLLIVLYPTIANLWNDYVDSKVKKNYLKEIASANVSKAKALAEKYNEKILNEGFTLDSVKDEEYKSILSFDSSGIMGYLEIPKIDISIPIYHYSTSEVLDLGIGHVAYSSLPIGGIGTHCLLTGHRGLPGKKLFTDIDEMTIGDEFYIHILNEVHAYMVDKIDIVEPESIETLTIDYENDYITLITCTPYSVNTHRLLVRGHRVDYEIKKENSSFINSFRHYFDSNQLIGLIILIAYMTIIIALRLKGGKNEKANN